MIKGNKKPGSLSCKAGAFDGAGNYKEVMP
jgi:hypothetical protein